MRKATVDSGERCALVFGVIYRGGYGVDMLDSGQRCVFVQTTRNVHAKIHFLPPASQPRPTLFGELTDDISNHEFLALRLRVAGHPRTRNSYYVNVQTDSPVSGELWQHRLYFRRDDGGWEDIFVRYYHHGEILIVLFMNNY